MSAKFLGKSPTVSDLEYWARMPGWTTTEAAALLLGLDPDAVVSEDDVPKVHRFQRVLERACQMDLLTNPVAPREFLEWAKSNRIDIPVALEEAVAKGKRIRNWRTSAKKYKRDLRKREDSVDDLSKKAKKSLYRILLALAKEHCGYVPYKNNNAAAQIEKTLAKHSLAEPKQETIRHWLETAFDEVGEDLQD
jgi:hypothetical protein